MELSFPKPAKTPKLFNDSNVVVGDYVDRISNLPDSLISHIFSFLPTKDILRTSILSKRWEFAWINAPILEFNDSFESFSNSTKLASFKDSIDRILFHHGGSTIKKCSLHCTTEFIKTKPLYAWICAVLSCNVRELTISSSYSLAFPKELPWGLFTSRTLVSLHISGHFVLNVPTYVRLPCLKSLSLQRVIYVDDSLMQRLFSSCPVLEDLSIGRQGWDGVLNAAISVPSLKRLSICVSHSNYPLECKITVDASSLEYLKIYDSVFNTVCVSCSPSLVEAHIIRCNAPGILREIAHVKHLCLFGPAMEDLRSDGILPVFLNLTRLELGVGDISGLVCWDLLSHLLICSPNLEVLVFFQGLVNRSLYPKGFYSFFWEPPEDPPECLGTKLKQIKVENFVGKPCEFFMISYMLMHAQVLEKMIINWYFDGPKYEVSNSISRRKILGFEKSSSTCQLEFGP